MPVTCGGGVEGVPLTLGAVLGQRLIDKGCLSLLQIRT